VDPETVNPPDDDAGDRRNARVEAVRRAVDQALAVTADSTRTTRVRAQDLADELGHVVTRVRGALEDLSSAGTAGAGQLAEEVQQAVGRLGRSIDEARPATVDDLRQLTARVDELEARLARVEGTPADAGPSADER
jgi:polyhydroxyalkanoate synthesis regulator phasin